jgi:chorismate mutase
MQLHLKVLTLMTASITINAGATGHSRFAEDQLQRLVETSAERLAIAEQVALAKWDSEAPVEDQAREAQVISDAVKVGEARGLKSDELAQFFRAQIELTNWSNIRC